MKKVKVIVFDLDDTLYHELTYVYEGFKSVCEYLSNKHKLSELELLNDMRKELELNGRGEIFNVICNKYNLNEDIKSLVKIYRKTEPRLSLYKDSLSFIEWCKELGYKIAIITDGDRNVQWKKIKALKLNEYADKIIVTDDYGKEFWKPHKRAYCEICDVFKVEANECIYIGDNPTKDFINAKKIGYKTVRIVRDMGDHIHKRLELEYEAEYEISTLEELKVLLKE